MRKIIISDTRVRQNDNVKIVFHQNFKFVLSPYLLAKVEAAFLWDKYLINDTIRSGANI